ncbi:MAG: hypothetical protein KH026_03205 [Clostridium sp.]|nr:hypothetical protein [Clostridium sp.]
MDRRYKGLIIAGIFLLGVVVFSKVQQRGGITYATAVGTVRTGKSLNVRKGPGTNYACLKKGSTTVRLKNEEQVTILAQNKKWYKIRLKKQSQKLVGYVPMKNLAVMSGDMNSEVYGTAYPSAVLVRSRAVRSGSLMRVDGAAVRLSKNKKVRILSESTMYGVKYYKVSFTYNGDKTEGYVPADSIKADYQSAMPGVISTSRQVTLKKKAGSTEIVKADGTSIIMKNGTEVLMLSEKIVSGVKYICVDVTYNKEVYRGYVTANLVRFKTVQVEDVVNGEQENLFVEKTTPAPAKTPEPENTAAPSYNSTDNSTGSTTVLNDKEFKQEMIKQGFPSSYITALQALHEKYPKWSFKAYQTGIDWSTAVDNEGRVGLNLISNSKSGDWKSQEEGAYNASTGTYIPFDGSTWVTASEKAVRYYMDPRNFLNESGIFQFESLEYQKGAQNQSGVENVLKNTPMYKASYEYVDDTGKSVTTTYSKTFMDAAALSSVSPYHLASRVKQEVVTGSTSMSSSVSGTVKGYEGIYNFYNIGANNSTKAGGAVANGLAWANKDTTYLRPWNTQYKAIVGGAQYLGSNYINIGQNTLYLQKFNVTANNTYNHQYMSNIEAPWSEALKTAEAYGTDKADMSLVFSIPVYSGMPSVVCPMPSGETQQTVQTVSTNNYLKSLSVKGYSFQSPFKSGDDGHEAYSLKLNKRVSSIRINASPVSSAAKVSGSGKKKLAPKVKSKTYVVKVKAESGDVRKYKIKVKRKK